MWTPNRKGYSEPFSQTVDTGVSYQEAVEDLRGVLQGISDAIESLDLVNDLDSGNKVVRCMVSSSDPPELLVYPDGYGVNAICVQVRFERPIAGHRYFASDAPYDSSPKRLEITGTGIPQGFLSDWLQEPWALPGGWECVEDGIESVLFIAAELMQCKILLPDSALSSMPQGSNDSDETMAALLEAYRLLLWNLVETIGKRPAGEFALLNLVGGPTLDFYEKLDDLRSGFQELVEEIEDLHLEFIREEMRGSGRIEKSVLDWFGHRQEQSEGRRSGVESVDQDALSRVSDGQTMEVPKEWNQEFWDQIGRKAVAQWWSDEAVPRVFRTEVLEFALRRARMLEPEKPQKKPAVNPDNSQAVFSGLFLGGSLLIGAIAILAIGFPPLVLLLLAPGVWLTSGMVRSQWTTPEQAEANARREYANELSRWEQSNSARQENLGEAFYLLLHRLIASAADIPERLKMEFAELSIKNESKFRSEWLPEIEEWAARPEFPEPPPPMPEKISHQNYESYCRDFMVSWGYLDARITRYSVDGGVDIESEQLVAQCKHFSKGTVGVREVREIFGVAVSEGKGAIIFTSGKYSAGAKEFADKNNVGLVLLRETDGIARFQNEPGREMSLRNQSS
jgi:hypothetical protein